MEDNKLCDQLVTACRGLVWSSESDFPWQVVYWPDISDMESLNIQIQTILQHCDRPPETKIATTTLESFLTPVITEREWHDEWEINQTKRYRLVQKLLQDNLTNIRVYSIGEWEIDIYILGKSDCQAIMGLSTKAIET